MLLDLFNLAVSRLGLDIIITIFFAGILWMKFLKQSKGFKPANEDELLDFIILSMFIYFSLVGSFAFIYIVAFALKRIPLTMKSLDDIISYLIPMIILLGFIFISQFKNKLHKSSLWQGITAVVELYKVFISLSLILFLTTLISTNLRVLFFLEFLTLNVIIISVTLFLRYLGVTLFKRNSKRKNHNYVPILNKKILTLWLPLIVLGTIIFSLTLIPAIKYEKPTKIAHYVIGENNKYREVYFKLSIPFNITSYGRLNPLIPFIYIPYNDYNLVIDGVGNENFNLVLKHWEGRESLLIKNFQELGDYNKRQQKTPGFPNIDVKKNKGYLIIKYNKKYAKDIKQIILKGLVKTNLSEEEYNYFDNSGYPNICAKGMCILKFNINSSSKLKIYHQGSVAFQLKDKVDSESNCQFMTHKINYYPNIDIKLLDTQCKESSCEIYLYDRSDTVFRTNLRIEGTVVLFDYIEIERPLNLSINVRVDCQRP